MSCKDINIDICVGCRLNSICWLEIFDKQFSLIKDENDAGVYMKAWFTSNNSTKEILYYIKAAIAAYHPQYIEIFNKLAILL